MLLLQTGVFNNLSEKLLEKLKARVDSFPKKVRYKFDISKENPDKTYYNGTVLWPSIYTLDPVQFTINDKEEAKGKPTGKKVALIESTDDKGFPVRYKKIKIFARDKGILLLQPHDNVDDYDICMFLELHPKNKTGFFPDPQRHQVFSIIDTAVSATEERKVRSARKLAMDTAEKMSDAEVIEFADAMMWDSSEDVLFLRNKAEELAESDPKMFSDIIADKKTKFLAAIKRALDKRIWQYDPSDGKLSWASTGQAIVTMGQDAATEGYGRYAEWFMTAGKQADGAFEKLLKLEKEPATT